jgi:Signal transduction histidine kinase
VLQALSTQPRYYDQTDLELAELLAIHVEEAVTRIRSERNLRESKRKIERLHAVATSLEACTDRETLLSEAVEAAGDVLSFDWCLIGRRHDGTFVAEAVSRETPVTAGDELDGVETGAAGRVVETGEPMLIDDVSANPVAEPAHESFRSGLLVPLGDGGALAAVSDEPGAFEQTDLELAELLAASVAAARDRIEARERLDRRQTDLDLLKDVYSRVLRHNLRNDLNVIGGAAEAARTADDDRLEELLDTIQRTATRLSATSERARQIKRVVDRTDPIRELSVRQAVEPVVERLRETEPRATITVDVPEQFRVRAHRDLPLAVECLVENGVDHNDAEPTVRVTAEQCDTVTKLRVADDGPGIPAHERSVIQRSRETDLEHGSGAGLWLARLVVDRSDGRLRFPERDDGTTVVVELSTAA